MSKAIQTARRESSGWRMYLLAGYYLSTTKFSLTVAFGGVLLIGLGAVVHPIMDSVGRGSENVEVMAGMFGIWGASLVLLGLVAYGILFANKKYAEMTSEES